MCLVGHALKMARIHYDIDTFYHAMRVAAYVAENQLIPGKIMNDCIALAIMHDLWEDTKYPKEDKQNYIEYIDLMKKYADKMPKAYWVKVADIKDHLCQTDTLTDTLKKKYLNALAHLL